MPSLRRNIEQSRLLADLIGRGLAGYLKLCSATTRWQVEGLDDLRECLARGPVILVLWHGHSLLGPAQWRRSGHPLTTLRDVSPIARVSGAVQERFGLRPVEMTAQKSNLEGSREVMRRLKDGISLGLTGDGPLGPDRVLKDAPLDWARASGRPVWVLAWATRRKRVLGTWDRMLFPLPFTSGAVVFRKWREDIPRKPDPQVLEEMRQGLTATLNAATDRAENLIS